MQRQSTNRFISRYAPLVIWLAFITIASSDQFSANNTSRFIGPLVLWLFPNTSPEQMATIHFFTRKLAHFSEYALLGLLAARAFRTSPNSTISSYWFKISLFLVIGYALLDEYHQSFVPSRTASIFDSFIDITGGLTALIVVRWRAAAKRSTI
jgi:VanZ family protein